MIYIYMYICSNCDSYADPYKVDKKIADVSGIQYSDMKLCENCFTATSSCAICSGDILQKCTHDTVYKVCQNCRCVFIYQTGLDPCPLDIESED